MSHMVTASGRKVYPRDLDHSEFVPSDIAIGLSRECRFNGACREFYSVGQHSIGVSQLLKDWGYDTNAQLFGLLHDAHEFCLRDVISPFRELLPVYRNLCAQVQELIEIQLIPGECDNFTRNAIKHADLVMLATEKRDLMPFDPDPWPTLQDIEPLPTRVQPYGHTWAAVRFLELYWQLADPEGERDLAIIMREAGL